MAFSLFSNQTMPIAIDFGTSSLKLLQIDGGSPGGIAAAAELPVPDSIRFDPLRQMEYYAENLPRILTEGKFKGKRAVISLPSSQTLIQHMQLADVRGASRSDLIKGQLNSQIGCSPENVVVRWIDVCEVVRDGQTRNEIICFAIAKDTVMRFVDLLKRLKLSVVGVHTEAVATVRAFEHLNRREEDRETTTMYIDMGWGGTLVAIAHGASIGFARYIQVGGRHFDHLIASTLNCDIMTARGHRLNMEGTSAKLKGLRQPTVDSTRENAILNAAANAHAAEGEQSALAATVTDDDRRIGAHAAALGAEVLPGNPPREANGVDLSELLDTMSDELSMCLRYHMRLFPSRSIDRAIFLGGEARQVWLCQNVIRSLRVPAQLGDPLARLKHDEDTRTPGLELDQAQPGWAVACGLSNAPADL